MHSAQRDRICHAEPHEPVTTLQALLRTPRPFLSRHSKR